jgi:aspartyl-tRNA(Asn)/glutamyl-tRNA(Gln) amidotransferase subunit C
MEFTPTEVDALARLARLSLTPEEHARFPRQLADIVGYARQVCDVVTTVVHDEAGSAAPSTLRQDVVQPSLERDAVIGPAPHGDHEAGLIKVPRVLG